MARQALQEWRKEHRTAWAAMNEPVLVGVAVTVAQTPASQRRGDIWADGVPDLDKLQRGIGDALAPAPLSPSDGAGLTERVRRQARDKMMADRRSQSVLHDDSKIVAWAAKKMYPATHPQSLGFPGCVVQVWRISELAAAEAFPVRQDPHGRPSMSVRDLWSWARPCTGETWDQAAARLWAGGHGAIFTCDAHEVRLRGRAITDDGVITVLGAMATGGPEARLTVVQEAQQVA